MKEYWVSCKKFTVWVQTDGEIITDCAPIVKKFRGQPLDNLKYWASKFGDFQLEKLWHS